MTFDLARYVTTTRPAVGRAWSAEPHRITGSLVEVTATIYIGHKQATMIDGLATTQTREFVDRVRAAVRNSGSQWPDGVVHIDVTPRALTKHAASHDLASACAVTAAAGIASSARLKDTLLLGELAIHGGIRHIPAIASRLRAARHTGLTRAVVPAVDADEASTVCGVETFGATRLADVLAWMDGDGAALNHTPTRTTTTTPRSRDHHEGLEMNVHDYDTNTGVRRNDGDEIRQARAYLMSVTEPPGHALLNLVHMVGPIEAATRVRDGTAPSSIIAETTPRTAHNRMIPVSEQFAAATAVGARLLIPEDPDWPAEAFQPLAMIHGEPHRHGIPLGLWVRGSANLSHALRRAVSMAGARAATEYGAQVAAEFGHDLAQLGAVIIAGTGYGIDAAAHRGALAASGATIAVLANGIAVTHPHGNDSLINQIADNGLVISEYPPTAQPTRRRHHVARRLIAGTTGGLVVVESLRRRGPVDAAATARALGKPVMVVPGPITSTMSAGCLELLREGQAVAVGNAEHVWQSCGFPAADSNTKQARNPARRT